MEPQTIFNKVVNRLRDGTGQAETSEGLCQYHAQDGSKCAVGIFIPDAFYSESLEGGDALDVAEYVEQNGISSLNFIVKNVHLLHDMQVIHDTDFNWKKDGHLSAKGESRLKQVAQSYSLKYKEPTV